MRISTPTRRAVARPALAAAAMAGLALSVAPASANPWDAMYSQRYTGKTYGGSAHVGEYQYVIKVYRLDDGGYKQGDFYRIDQKFETAIHKGKYSRRKKVRKKGTHCGWASDLVRIGFDLDGKGAVIHDYGPTTYSGSASYSDSISWKQGAGAPQIEAGYSMSTTIPDEGVKAFRNIGRHTILWEGKLRGCGDVGKPNYEGASRLASTSYMLETTTLIQVDEGQRFTWKNHVGGDRTRVTTRRVRWKFPKRSTDLSHRDLKAMQFNCGRTGCTRKR